MVEYLRVFRHVGFFCFWGFVVRKEGGKIVYAVLAVAMLSTVNSYADISFHSNSQKPRLVPEQAVLQVKYSPLAGIDCLSPNDQPVLDPGFAKTRNLGSQKVETKEFPAGPDSAMLFLFAMGSIGVFHVGKSAKKFNFALVPDWYHSGGLRQVGHVYALDLDFYLVAMHLAAFFDRMVVEPKISYPILLEALPRLESQFSLTIKAPRGPPILS